MKNQSQNKAKKTYHFLRDFLTMRRVSWSDKQGIEVDTIPFMIFFYLKNDIE